VMILGNKKTAISAALWFGEGLPAIPSWLSDAGLAPNGSTAGRFTVSPNQ